MDTTPYVVGGASDGIGRALALRFAAQGANVVVAARGVAGFEETVRFAGDAASRILAVPTDVADPAACRRLRCLGLQRDGA